MTSIRKVIQTLTVMILIFGMVGPLGVPSAMAAAHTHPLLLQMASEAPEQQVAVIVQKSDKSDQAEALVRRLGGEVTKDLHIINAFATEMDAGAALELARDPGVRWVSLDAPVIRSAIITENVADIFNVRAYSNNDGTRPWSGNWIEIADDNKPDSGKVKIDKSMMRLEDKGRGIWRTANLQGAVTAHLKLQYQRESMNQAANYVDVQVSSDGGAT